jgi:hypothetical protein
MVTIALKSLVPSRRSRCKVVAIVVPVAITRGRRGEGIRAAAVLISVSTITIDWVYVG